MQTFDGRIMMKWVALHGQIFFFCFFLPLGWRERVWLPYHRLGVWNQWNRMLEWNGAMEQNQQMDTVIVVFLSSNLCYTMVS